jgi:two-component system, NarL family, sensor histidine kinase DegS
MTDAETTSPPSSLAQLSSRLVDDVRDLDRELGEVDLLVEQAKTEAARHVARSSSTADKLTALQVTNPQDTTQLLEVSAQLVTLTKRAALMESQVDVLEGKRRALGRYRDALAGYATLTADLSGSDPGGLGSAAGLDPDAPMPAAVSRLVLTMQEDLRREISRAMHDGPAQSLTNIVLQAQIVEHLVTHDPVMAQKEVRQLIAMVQQTLDATKTFIFDVRPMVLDDLGLLATLRRAARERGRRADVEIEFDSMGQDRRLATHLESGLFRIVDDALAAYLDLAPDHLSLKLEWSTRLEIRLAATRTPEPEPASSPVPASAPPKKKSGKEEELPPALAAMIEEREAHERDVAEAARRQTMVGLPDGAWREIQARAASIDVTAHLLDDGSQLVLLTEATAPGT